MSDASLNRRDGVVSATEASKGLSPSMVRRAIFASVLGNGLEWFDFLIYGYFAKIIAQVFFPDGGFVSIMLTLAFPVDHFDGGQHAVDGPHAGLRQHRHRGAVAGGARAAVARALRGRPVRDGVGDAGRVCAAA
jgi:hypothetical protein